MKTSNGEWTDTAKISSPPYLKEFNASIFFTKRGDIITP